MNLQMICDQQDIALGGALLREAREHGATELPFLDLVALAGRCFLGAPYQAGSLEREGPERLVVNLRSFDCVTFVENSLVLAELMSRGVTNFSAYAQALEKIRYRRGRCDGYPSRLHYFTDWLYDSGRKGLVQDITRPLGGIPYPKAFHALTDRRSALPGLKDAAAFRRMRILEGLCSRRPLHYLPMADCPKAAEKIIEGDLIAVTTNEPGVDVSHVGIAVRKGRTVHLLHASSAAGKVVLTDGTVVDYLAEKPSRMGLIVGRPIAPKAHEPAPSTP